MRICVRKYISLRLPSPMPRVLVAACLRRALLAWVIFFMTKRGCRLSFHALFLYVGKIETLPRAHFWYLLRVKNEFAREGNAMSSPSQVGN